MTDWSLTIIVFLMFFVGASFWLLFDVYKLGKEYISEHDESEDER